MNHIRKPVTLLLICCLLVGLSLTSSISATAQTITAEQMELEEFDLEAEYGEIYVREDGVKEDVFSRKENAKLFEEPDGTMTFEIYGERQHFLDDGKYVTIDNEVVEMQPAQRASLASSQSSGYRYMNKANDVHVLFSDAASLTDMVMVQKGDYTLTLSAQSATGLTAATSSALAKATTKSWLSKYQGDDSTVIYGRDKNISYIYQVQNNGVKEEIVMGQYTGQNVFTFAIKAPGLVVAQGTNGDYVFRSQETNEEVFYLETPFMYDAEGKVSYDVTYAFTPVQNGYTLTVTASEDFLTDPNTVYPVTIDPSVINAYPSFLGVSISSAQPNYSVASTVMKLETNSSSYGTRRALIKFSLPSELNGVTVNSAQLELTASATQGSNIAFIRLASSWTRNVTWNTAPTGYTIGYAANALGKYILDVTSDVNGYLSGSLTNYGYLLRLGDETRTDAVTLYSNTSLADKMPKLVINVNGITGMLRYPVMMDNGTRYAINQNNLFANASHTGIDITTKTGTTPINGKNIYAVYTGTVKKVSDDYLYGQGVVIFIEHSINGVKYYSKYCHLQSRYVNEGDTVTKNTVIGTVGNSGDASKGYHLHLEICRCTAWNQTGSATAINPEQCFELCTGISGHNTAMVYGEIKNYTTCSSNCKLKIAVYPSTLSSNYENNTDQQLPRLPHVATNPKAWGWAYSNNSKSTISPNKFAIGDIDLGTADSKTVYVVAYGCSSCANRNGNIVLKKQVELHSGEIVYVSLDANPS